MIKPTIGRVVLFNNGRSAQRVPASVCFVHNDTMINIGGFDANGKAFSAKNVHLIPSDSSAPCNKGQAEWMEYQKSVHVEDESDKAETGQDAPVVNLSAASVADIVDEANSELENHPDAGKAAIVDENNTELGSDELPNGPFDRKETSDTDGSSDLDNEGDTQETHTG